MPEPLFILRLPQDGKRHRIGNEEGNLCTRIAGGKSVWKKFIVIFAFIVIIGENKEWMENVYG